VVDVTSYTISRLERTTEGHATFAFRDLSAAVLSWTWCEREEGGRQDILLDGAVPFRKPPPFPIINFNKGGHIVWLSVIHYW
jgi:hypothetical protein